MTANIILGAFLSVTGICSSLLGMLFLVASKGEGTRLSVGLIMLGAGVPLLFVGIKLFKRGIQTTPSAIKNRLLKLARKNHGEISVEAVTGELGSSDDIKIQINEFISSGIARETVKDGRKYYLFPDFHLELIVKKCPYCGNDYPVRDEIENCPNCGGDLKMFKSRIADAEKKFSMDDDDDSGLS